MTRKPSPVPAVLTIGITAGYFAVLIGMLGSLTALQIIKLIRDLWFHPKGKP